MYFTNDGFVISGREIIAIIVAMIICITILRFLGGRTRNSTDIADVFADYPVSAKFPDVYEKNKESSEFDTDKKEKDIFEERISGVLFRYDEKTRVLTIGDSHDLTNTDIPPVEVKLDYFNEFREFVDRLEKYVNE